jgi:hypothetical protein
VSWTLWLGPSDYNAFSVGRIATWQYGAAELKTLAAWRGATPFDAHSLSGDPMLMDPERGDCRLASGSPARGAGMGGVDMGAYPTGAGRVGPDW